MNYLLWLLIGLILGSALLPLVRPKSIKDTNSVLTMGLIIAVGCYIAFAISHGTFLQLLINISVIPLFGIFIWLSYIHTYKWLALGWGVHAICDSINLALNWHVAPEWYATACVSFDLLIALYLLGSLGAESLKSDTIN